MSKDKTAEEANGDALSVKIGGALVRKLLPYLIGGGVLGGGTYVKTQHDNDIKSLQANQASTNEAVAKLDGKMDTVIELIKAGRK